MKFMFFRSKPPPPPEPDYLVGVRIVLTRETPTSSGSYWDTVLEITETLERIWVVGRYGIAPDKFNIRASVLKKVGAFIPPSGFSAERI